MLKKCLLSFLGFICFSSIVFSQQEKKQDSLQIISKNPKEAVTINCKIVQGHKKLKGRRFASAQPLYLRANKDTLTYGVFQFGKRGKDLFLYVKILDESVCLKKEENFDILFASGEKMTLKNQFPINCEGAFAHKLKAKEIDEIVFKKLTKISIYTYYKNYEFLISPKQSDDIITLIQCLRRYKVK